MFVCTNPWKKTLLFSWLLNVEAAIIEGVFSRAAETIAL